MIGVTIGGVLVGLCLLAWQSVQWYPGLKALKNDPVNYAADWLPFLFGWAYGALATLTTMGVIGWAFDTALWASNWLGDAALWIGVGQAPGHTASGAPVHLGVQGSAVVLFLTVVIIAVIKFRPSGPQIKRGVWCGTCLGTSAGVAGFAAGPLALGANWLGVTVFGGV